MIRIQTFTLLSRQNDVITVVPSTEGEPARMELGELAEYGDSINVNVNGKMVSLPKFANVNGASQSAYYDIKSGDGHLDKELLSAEQIVEFL